MEYRYHNQPGGGGCLLLAALPALVTGGLPALSGKLLGFFLTTGLAFVLLLVGGFFAFSYYVQRRVSTYAAPQTEIDATTGSCSCWSTSW